MANTGGYKLREMIGKGMINAPFLWLDCYNGTTKPLVAGTIVCGYDFRNHWYVTHEHLKDRKEQTMIAQINPRTRECRCFDIRKLTPRETGRLMGVQEWALDRMIEGNQISSSSLYKLFGNSIVVHVMVALFRQAWFRTEDEQNQPRQLSLFPEPEWPKHMYDGHPLRLIELCAGYGSQALAFDMLREEFPELSYELTAWAELDPETKKPLDEQPAVVAHKLLHPDAGPNLGDMTIIDWRKEMAALGIKEGELDLLTYSTPCQSISQAGKRAGIAKGSGTRSSILWNTADAIEALKPKFLMQENVAALVNQEYKPHFDQWRQVLSDLGYDSDYRVLNAKDYGVPQNRDRVFCLSWRRDLGLPREFPWPKPITLTRTIADVLEPEADSRYFLRPESVKAFLTKNTSEQMVYATVDHQPSEAEIDEIIKNQESNE